MSYNSKYTGAEVDAALGKALTALQEHQDISGKQDVISDLAAIRSGASKGATALQSVPSEYVTEDELANKGYATASAMNAALGNKVDKVNGKQLSTEDFTTALKNKLNGLSNYDDTEISQAVSKLRTDLDTLVSGDTTTAIKTFNEVIAFLDGITDSQDLGSIIASIEQQIAGKMDKVVLSAVATSGSYKDLDDKPSLDEVNGILSIEKGGTGATTAEDARANLGITPANIGAPTVGEMNAALKGKQDKNIKFTDLAANIWESDDTYAEYPYRCDVDCSGVTADMYAEVVFNINESTSGEYAPICETKTNTVSIWSSSDESITIPTIIITK